MRCLSSAPIFSAFSPYPLAGLGCAMGCWSWMGSDLCSSASTGEILGDFPVTSWWMQASCRDPRMSFGHMDQGDAGLMCNPVQNLLNHLKMSLGHAGGGCLRPGDPFRRVAFRFVSPPHHHGCQKCIPEAWSTHPTTMFPSLPFSGTTAVDESGCERAVYCQQRKCKYTGEKKQAEI